MKLIIAIVKDSDALNVTDALVEQQYGVTRMASTGGFLRRGNVTLLIGVESDETAEVFQIIQKHCEEPEPGRHKATVFVLPADNFLKLG